MTGILARQQKLVHKGRVLAGGLADAGVRDGATLLLLGGAGTAGGVAAAVAAKKRQAADGAAAVKALKGGGAGAVADRGARWTAVRAVSLRGEGQPNLDCVPAAAAAVATSVDAGANALLELAPAFAAAFPRLARLRLDANRLTTLPPLPQTLTSIDLAGNLLGAVPAPVASLPRLARLSLERCGLAALPASFDLPALQELIVAGNELAELPASLGGCPSLARLDARANRLTSVHPALAALPALKCLLLDGNRLTTLPPGFLASATALADLSLAGNELTLSSLRSADPAGHAAFDARRVATANARLAARVDPDGGGWRSVADGEGRAWGGEGRKEGGG